jgi:hypothetical protein
MPGGVKKGSVVKEDFVCREAVGCFSIPSFSRKRESSLCFMIFASSPPAWMPACAGMTDFHVI